MKSKPINLIIATGVVGAVLCTAVVPVSSGAPFVEFTARDASDPGNNVNNILTADTVFNSTANYSNPVDGPAAYMGLFGNGSGYGRLKLANHNGFGYTWRSRDSEVSSGIIAFDAGGANAGGGASLTVTFSSMSTVGASESYRFMLEDGGSYYASQSFSMAPDVTGQITSDTLSNLNWIVYNPTNTAAGIADFSGASATPSFSSVGFVGIIANFHSTTTGNADLRMSHFALNPAPTPPAAPANLTGSATENSVALDWDDNIEPDLAYYTVYRSVTNGGPYSVVESGLTNSAYTDVPLAGSTTYYYVLTASDDESSESPYSAELTVMTLADVTPPDIPTNFTAVVNAPGITLAWATNAEAAVDFDHYTLYRSEIDGGPYDILVTNTVANSYTDVPVVDGTIYYYVVSAYDVTGNESTSAQADATAVDADPLAPTGLKTVSLNNSVAVSWYISEDAEGDIASYSLYRSETSGDISPALITNMTGTVYQDDAVTNGTTYYYKVSAVDDAGQEGSLSGEVSALPIDRVFVIDFLPDDPTITSNPDLLPENDPNYNVWRVRTKDPYWIQWRTDSNSMVGFTDSFAMASDPTAHDAVITNANYHPDTAEIIDIAPDWTANVDLYHNIYGGIGTNHIINGWYTITLQTSSDTYTATSGVGRIHDGTAPTTAVLSQNLTDKWNRLDWDTDPFSGGGIAFGDIVDVDITFTGEVITDNADATGIPYFHMYNVPIKYTVSMPSIAPLAAYDIVSYVLGAGGTNVTITWESEADATYRILSSPGLIPASWTPVVTNIASAGDGTTSESVPTTATVQFYKVDGIR